MVTGREPGAMRWVRRRFRQRIHRPLSHRYRGTLRRIPEPASAVTVRLVQRERPARRERHLTGHDNVGDMELKEPNMKNLIIGAVIAAFSLTSVAADARTTKRTRTSNSSSAEQARTRELNAQQMTAGGAGMAAGGAGMQSSGNSMPAGGSPNSATGAMPSAGTADPAASPSGAAMPADPAMPSSGAAMPSQPATDPGMTSPSTSTTPTAPDAGMSTTPSTQTTPQTDAMPSSSSSSTTTTTTTEPPR